MKKENRKKSVLKLVVKKNKANRYEKLPNKLSDLKEGYKALVRELGKR